MRSKETIICLVFDIQLGHYFVESLSNFRRRDFDSKLSVIEHGTWSKLKNRADKLNAQVATKYPEL